MRREKARVKQFTWWSWCIIGAMVLMALPACAQVVKRIPQTGGMPLRQISSGHISIRPLGTWPAGHVPRGPQVSIVGDQVHIEIFSPVVIDIKPLQEPPDVKSELEKSEKETRLGRGRPIISAPTP